jgi:hypothetical protein
MAKSLGLAVVMIEIENVGADGFDVPIFAEARTNIATADPATQTDYRARRTVRRAPRARFAHRCPRNRRCDHEWRLQVIPFRPDARRRLWYRRHDRSLRIVALLDGDLRPIPLVGIRRKSRDLIQRATSDQRRFTGRDRPGAAARDLLPVRFRAVVESAILPPGAACLDPATLGLSGHSSCQPSLPLTLHDFAA